MIGLAKRFGSALWAESKAVFTPERVAQILVQTVIVTAASRGLAKASTKLPSKLPSRPPAPDLPDVPPLGVIND